MILSTVIAVLRMSVKLFKVPLTRELVCFLQLMGRRIVVVLPLLLLLLLN